MGRDDLLNTPPPQNVTLVQIMKNYLPTVVQARMQTGCTPRNIAVSHGRVVQETYFRGLFSFSYHYYVLFGFHYSLKCNNLLLYFVYFILSLFWFHYSFISLIYCIVQISQQLSLIVKFIQHIIEYRNLRFLK